jgi:hypothetical protein
MPSHDKKSAADLRAELRALRKEKVKPISRMRMGDISAEIERLRGAREETPAVASVPSAPPRKLKAAAETIKEAKRSEFPVAPASEMTKKGRAAPKAKAAPAAEPPKKKESKLAKLMRMMESMSDSEEE